MASGQQKGSNLTLFYECGGDIDMEMETADCSSFTVSIQNECAGRKHTWCKESELVMYCTTLSGSVLLGRAHLSSKGY